MPLRADDVAALTATTAREAPRFSAFPSGTISERGRRRRLQRDDYLLRTAKVTDRLRLSMTTPEALDYVVISVTA